MRIYTLDDIRALALCDDPADLLPENWAGSIIDLLRLDNVDIDDRLWVALHLIDERIGRLFAVWCARRALALIENPDTRIINLCHVAEKFANGDATRDELNKAFFKASSVIFTSAGMSAEAAGSYPVDSQTAFDCSVAAIADAAYTNSISHIGSTQIANDAWHKAYHDAHQAHVEQLIEIIMNER